MITRKQQLDKIYMSHKRMIAEASSSTIRQVEIPKSSSGSSSSKKPVVKQSKPSSTKTKSSKSSPTKVNKKSPAKKTTVVPKKKEHIQGDSNKINFEQDGQQFTGFIEKRGPGKFDIVVVKGQFTVVKSATETDVAERVRAAAAKLISGDGGSKSQKKKTSDILLPPEENED